MFSFGWHVGTYRGSRVGRGAFELCLPSLGNHYQNNLLRTQYLGGSSRSGWSWGEDRRLSDRVTLPIVCIVCVVCGVCVIYFQRLMSALRYAA